MRMTAIEVLIVRAFHKYPDIVNIQIFNTTGEEYLRIERQVNRDFYVKAPASALLKNDPVFLQSRWFERRRHICRPKSNRCSNSGK